MKSPDHFRWRDLRPMLEANGWYNAIAEINALAKESEEASTKRRKRLQELLRDVIYNHETGACKCKFRPCHARKLETLEVDTEFWLV